MKKTLAVLVFATMTLVGCGDKEATEGASSSHNEGTLEEVVVDIQTAKTLSVEDVVLSAKVSQSDEAVDDATVEFEVWESGLREEGHMVEGNLTEDGVYEANYSFDHDGVYYMFAHTNARGLHVMPKQELIVGEPDMSKVIPDESDDSMSHMNHE
ncbi:FixH family protein [Psychrobacillus psychrodurans]|uniref:FixH family protein n=1 Tax=Psychrobacillus TaxID=1221880 RepID=UPI0008E23826|nr:FixH family protein [Psychrobacillus psychrodurans]MCK1998213.1 FixH family protein [Psychrobacillus psychrodurans]MCZ8542190.1 FixH family protein [Psychrobacillus psychrodurans]SFN18955.1 YtkA-like [Psychrobacillus psychrodurans]